MRLRLFHQVFLLVAGTAIIVQLVVIGATSWTLQRGFGDYLKSRDQGDLAAVVARAASRLAARGADPATALSDLVEGQPPPRPDNDRGSPPPSGASRIGSSAYSENRQPPPDAFGERLAIYAVDGRQLFGSPERQPPDPTRPLQRAAIRRDGHIVAIAILRPRTATPSGVDARFLDSQYRTAIIMALVILALAALPAWWIARRVLRRLETIQTASQSIARGDFAVSIAETGADEITETMRNINVMARSLARLDRTRRQWLAEVSHELRTPLTVIRGDLDALYDGIRPLDKAAIAPIVEEAERLSATVDDLHFLAMSDLDGLPSTFAPADAAELCRTTVDRYRPAAHAARLELKFEVHRGDFAVSWDARRVDQLLTNLLANGLRYTDAPGKIRVQIRDYGNTISIEVDDSAPAVAIADLPRLFDALFRVDAARSRTHGGSGLGLAVVEAIVRSHHGQVSASASLLGGLAVRIDLPRVPLPA